MALAGCGQSQTDQDKEASLQALGLLAWLEASGDSPSAGRLAQVAAGLEASYREVGQRAQSTDGSLASGMDYETGLGFLASETSAGERAYFLGHMVRANGLSGEAAAYLTSPGCANSSPEACLFRAQQIAQGDMAQASVSDRFSAKWGIPGIIWYQDPVVGWACIVPQWGNAKFGLGRAYWPAAFLCAIAQGYLVAVGTGDRCFYILYPNGCN